MEESSNWTRTRWTAALFLFAVYVLHSLDRYVFGVVLEPIKHEFNFTDTQMGALAGSAHAIGFTLFVLPVGYLLDRTNRVKMLSTMLGVWSAVTALCAATTGYGSLFLMRAIVGAAESTTSAGTQSLVSSSFPVKMRASAMGMVYSGLAVGTGLAFVIGGYVAQHYGWREVFLIVGVPGVLLGLLMWRKSPEPVRDAENVEQAHAAPMWEVFKFFIRSRPVLFNSIGLAIVAMNVATVWVWITPVLVREQGFSLAWAGAVVGFAAGVMKFASAVLSGFLSDWIAKGRVDRMWIVPSVALTLSAPIALSISIAPNPTVAAVLVALLGLTLGTHYGSPKASMMTATPAQMRGSIGAMQELAANAFGALLGPLITGAINDKLGGQSISLALGATVSVNVIAALAFWIAVSNFWARKGTVATPSATV